MLKLDSVALQFFVISFPTSHYSRSALHVLHVVAKFLAFVGSKCVPMLA